MTLGGTDTTAGARQRNRRAPPAEALVSITVPVEAPPVTEVGFAESEATVTPASMASTPTGRRRSRSPSMLRTRGSGCRCSSACRTCRRYTCRCRCRRRSGRISRIARKILRRFGSLVRSAGSWPLTFVFSRSRAPIGNAPAVDPRGAKPDIHSHSSRAPSRETHADIGDRGVPASS